jgi:hypothetical protein
VCVDDFENELVAKILNFGTRMRSVACILGTVLSLVAGTTASCKCVSNSQSSIKIVTDPYSAQLKLVGQENQSGLH